MNVRLNLKRCMAALIKLDMSNFDLMCESNLSASSVSRALSGKKIHTRTAAQLCKALKLEPEYALIYEDETNKSELSSNKNNKSELLNDEIKNSFN